VLGNRRIVTVAMMRPGDKIESYRMLARALERIDHLGWELAVAGDGPMRDEVRGEFARFDPARVEWLGELSSDEVARLYARGSLYVWPGFGEAFGLAYLEAQAAGLPVVAQAIDGVPGVVRDGKTGMLTPPGDAAAMADAIAVLLDDGALRRSMSEAARRFVLEERSLEIAAKRLGEILHRVMERDDA
jgi:glycosyltransferase involved in cell wall biosynthesis